jgi:hypothetical protein
MRAPITLCRMMTHVQTAELFVIKTSGLCSSLALSKRKRRLTASQARVVTVTAGHIFRP